MDTKNNDNIIILGCRGSVPVSGKEFVKYGGATTCVLVNMSGEQILLDAGTGAISAAKYLDASKHLSILLTHPHADHLLGFPMMAPVFDSGYSIDIYLRERQGLSPVEQLRRYMAPPLWPVGPEDLKSKVTISDMPAEFCIGKVRVRTMEGVHPGGVSVLRLTSAEGRSLVFMTDCTITSGLRSDLLEFVRDADIVLIDGQYRDQEWRDKSGFGHNTANYSAAFALEAGAKNAYIIHHDSSRVDAELNAMDMEVAKINPTCTLAREGQRITFDASSVRISKILEGTEEISAEDISRFLEVSLALSAESDREKLLTMILDTAMDITNCDAGTLYLLEEDGLHFCRMETRSQGVRQGGYDSPITLPPVPLDQAYVCSWSVINNKLINVENVHTDKRWDFSGSAKYDAMTGYNTQTMMVVPLSNDKGELIGAAQLINALDEEGNIIPFSSGMELLVSAAASQAAISITNMKYSEQIKGLLDSLVGALSTAIDERTPYNANHTRNMVKYGANFLDWLRTSGTDWEFDPDKRQTFLLSVWLHDVGKLVVPLEVMDKDSRLGPATARVLGRIRKIKLLNRLEMLEGKITKEQMEEANAKLDADMDFVTRINTQGFLPDEDLAEVDRLSKLTYIDENGETLPFLTEGETVSLSVRKGTLTAEERVIMENHVVSTSKILGNVSFPKMYEKVPEWAGSHHELMNGRGYPRHLKSDDIPREVRLLTILDVFDALTAMDRPYKPGMPVVKALSILGSMADAGDIDKDILNLFEQSKAWEDKK